MSTPEPVAPSSNYQVVETPVAPPTPKSQEMVFVRRSELRTLRRGIERALSDPVAAAAGWASAWFGFGSGATLTTVALLAVEGDDLKPGILAALIAAAFIGLFLAAFMHWTDRKERAKRKTAQRDLCEQVDELDQRAPSTVQDQP